MHIALMRLSGQFFKIWYTIPAPRYLLLNTQVRRDVPSTLKHKLASNSVSQLLSQAVKTDLCMAHMAMCAYCLQLHALMYMFQRNAIACWHMQRESDTCTHGIHKKRIHDTKNVSVTPKQHSRLQTGPHITCRLVLVLHLCH